MSQKKQNKHLLLAVLMAAVSLTGLTAQAAPQAGQGLSRLDISSPIGQKLLAALRATTESSELSKSGDEAAQEKAWPAAIGLYKQALDVWKDNAQADYGLAQCYAALGDKPKEIEAYRAGIFNGEAKPGNVREDNTVKLMSYVLLLSQAGQADEATYVYNVTAKKLNDYEQAKKLGLLLPTFGSSPGQVAYTSARLQAMAHVGLGVDTLYNQWTKPQDKLAHLQEAVRLAPDCADTYYHLSGYFQRVDPAQAKAAYDKGAKLDSLVPGAAARLAAGKPQ